MLKNTIHNIQLLCTSQPLQKKKKTSEEAKQEEIILRTLTQQNATFLKQCHLELGFVLFLLFFPQCCFCCTRTNYKELTGAFDSSGLYCEVHSYLCGNCLEFRTLGRLYLKSENMQSEEIPSTARLTVRYLIASSQKNDTCVHVFVF